MTEKLSAPLRMQLDGITEARASDTLGVLIKCSGPVTDAMKLALQKIHVDTQSIIGDICTARGTSEAIKAATNLDFVTGIELSQKRKPTAE